MRLDGPLAQEEGGRDLPVRATFGDELRDAALGGCQSFLSSAPADPAELRTRVRGPAEGTDHLESLERGRDRFARVALPSRAASDDPERQQCPRAAEWVAHRLVFAD